MGLNGTNPVFLVSDKTRLKPVSSATEISWKIEKLLVASLDIILFNKRITKALIRRSVHLLFENTKDRFSRVEAPLKQLCLA